MPKMDSRCQNTIPALSLKDSKRILKLSTHAISIWLIVECAATKMRRKRKKIVRKSLIFSQKCPFLSLQVVFCTHKEFWGELNEK